MSVCQKLLIPLRSDFHEHVAPAQGPDCSKVIEGLQRVARYCACLAWYALSSGVAQLANNVEIINKSMIFTLSFILQIFLFVF